MIELIKRFTSCRVSILISVLSISAIALAGALTAQFAFELEPCILCLYQRIPFVLCIIAALIGLAFKPARSAAIGFCALAFMTNAGLAFYHVGVEQRWWVSAFEACAVPDSFLNPEAQTESLLDQLLKTPSVPCTQIAWTDPVFGASMAVYNVLLCAGMAVFCLLHFMMRSANMAKYHEQ